MEWNEITTLKECVSIEAIKQFRQALDCGIVSILKVLCHVFSFLDKNTWRIRYEIQQKNWLAYDYLIKPHLVSVGKDLNQLKAVKLPVLEFFKAPIVIFINARLVVLWNDF